MNNHGHRTGERFRGKRIRYRKGSWIILPLAVAAWILPTAPAARATNLITNGTFDGSTGWTILQNGGSGLAFPGALIFSYDQGSVSQTVPATPGQTLNASFTVDNSQANRIGPGDPIPDTWTATLSSGGTVSEVTRSVAHGLETFSLSVLVPQGASAATLTFSGKDFGFWAGNYGPAVDNVTMSATAPALPITPANNGCGPYPAVSVTGTIGGPIWGSNPYTDDSNLAAAAVHAGLIAPGETAIIQPYLVDNYPSYPGSTANGITTSDWNGSWCGYRIKILGEDPTTSAKVWENEILTLEAPAGSVFTGIQFMSYGTPSGENGNYSIDQGCHATLSATQQSALLGSNTLVIGANNSVFGDPCPGTGKWLAVVASYSTPTPPTTTTTTTTTTTAPKSLGAPTNVSVTNTESGVLVDWSASNDDSGVSPERYAITWSNGTSGWGVATGNVGDANALNTQILLNYSLFESTGGLNTEYTFTVRADNDTYGIYSQSSQSVTLVIDTPEVPTTWPESTSTSTTSTVAPIPSVDVPTTTVPVISTDPTPITTDAPAPATTTSPTPTDAPAEETLPPETTVAEPETTDPAPETTDPEPEPGPGDDVTELSPEELATVDDPAELEALIDSGDIDALDSEQLLSIVTNDSFTELSAEAFSEVLDAVFDEPLSDEEFQDVLDSVLDAPLSDEQFDALVDVLGSDTVSDEQVQAAVDQIIENGLTEEFATSLATSGEILESIDGEAAAEIFAEVPISEITDEEAAEIVAAVQDAPEEVRNAFETEINIFGAGSLDTYVPIGSAIDVGARRVIIAATTVVSVLTVASPPSSPAPASPSGSGSGSGGPSGSGGGASAEPSSERRRRLPGGR